MSTATNAVAQPHHPLESHPSLRKVLDRLHAISLSQEAERAGRGTHFPSALATADGFEDQLVALDEDKCKAMYSILRAMGATRIVEGK